MTRGHKRDTSETTCATSRDASFGVDQPDLQEKLCRERPGPAKGAPSSDGGSCWRPGTEWFADLPFVTDRVDDPAEPPAVTRPRRATFPSLRHRGPASATLLGSSTTSSVRLVRPSIARGLSRFNVEEAGATRTLRPDREL